ncbi:MAG: class I SAM-dependent methyltransferase [bacterium]|nr:class I SAM-dependent methyltransferase [bacterium]
MKTETKKVTCPVCKTKTPANKSFCENCRYPIAVKKISGFNVQEITTQLLTLSEVTAKTRKPLFKKKLVDEAYTELISLNWLRPESALWSFLEMRLALSLKKKYLTYPMLDLGCGEGLWTSILFGAKINKKYDAYEAINLSKSDLYNTYLKPPTDLFETVPSHIGFGLDIKENSVQKARDLHTYDEVKVGDVRNLPFGDTSVNSVFSNMIDDINTKDLKKVFTEVHRVLRGGGYMVFTTPNERFRKFLFYCNKAKVYKKQGDVKNYKLFSILDRGRSEWEPRPLTLWHDLFKETSFELVDHIEYADEQVVQLWDTGFRPFFKQLMETRNVLKKNDILLPTKEVAVAILKQWLLQYAKNETSRDGAFSMIVAKKI